MHHVQQLATDSAVALQALRVITWTFNTPTEGDTNVLKFDKNKVHSHNSLPGTKLHIFYTFFGHNPVLHTCTIDTTNIVQLFDRLVWCNMNDKWLQITCVPWDVTR